MLLLPMAGSAQPVATTKDNLTIIAESSLMLPLADLTRLYTKTTGTPLTVLRNDARDPAEQIEQGFEAHILLSANPTLVQRLAQRGLIDVFGTQSFARTQLALVAPYRLKQKLALAKRISFAALLFSQPDMPIYAAAPSTPGGLRAQGLLQGREFSHELAARMVVKENLGEIVDALRKEDALALILAANAVTEPDVTILSLVPENISEPVRYDAVVLASESMEQARAFTKFLASAPAQAILAHYGFQPPDTGDESN